MDILRALWRTAGFATLLATLFLAGAAHAAKVDVCHLPPDNTANFHTIKISENALGAHLAHGDFTGPCDALCQELCDDGDACTIDDTADCEQNGCPTTHEPVDCDDSNACTDDTCNPLGGCSNVALVCESGDLCTVSACSDGFCYDTPKSCDSGESCEPETGLCEPDATCGDGIVNQPTELCDRGSLNGTAGSGCLADCTLEPDVDLSIRIHEHCDPASVSLLFTQDTPVLDWPTNLNQPSYLTLGPNTGAIVYSGVNFTGDQRTFTSNVNFCTVAYPSGAGINDNVESVQLFLIP